MPLMITARPDTGENAAYYQRYIDAVPAGDLIQVLATQSRDLETLLRPLTDAEGAHRYAPGKWSVRQVIGHLIDTERVFAFRAVFMAHSDPARLPGFDQDVWVAAGDYDARTVSDLLDEFISTRQASIAMARGLSDAALLRRGIASDCEFSVRALLCILAGHVAWHVERLGSDYGLGAPWG